MKCRGTRHGRDGVSNQENDRHKRQRDEVETERCGRQGKREIQRERERGKETRKRERETRQKQTEREE